MPRRLTLALFVCACSASPAPQPTPEATPEAPATPEAAATPEATATPDHAVASVDCVIRAAAHASPAASADLLAVAPQYFHAYHSGGFDAYRGRGDVFPYFELGDLEHPFLPPRGARVTATTRTAILLVSRSGELGLMRRGQARPSWLGEQVYPELAVEDASGQVWALVRSSSSLRILHISTDGAIDAHDLGFAPRARLVALALSRDGRPVLAYATREAGRLALKLSWSLDPADGIEVDHVDLPVPVAELSEHTGLDVALAPDGPHDIAVAWRPLTDAGLTDTGSSSDPPMTPAAAEVRWTSVTPDGAIAPMHRHATHAQPLGGTTGVGPWGLSPCGLRGGTLAGRALFAWIGDADVSIARAPDADATRLAPAEGSPLIGFRGSDDAREVLLLDSSPRIRAFELRCGAP